MNIAGTDIIDPATMPNRSLDQIVSELKTISPDMAAWVRAEDVDAGGTGSKMVSPYSQSAWVYTAVSILAKTIAQIPFRISRVGGGKAKRVRMLRGSHQPAHRGWNRRALNSDILESGDVVDLFNRPHPTMDRKMFWEMIVTWNALRGEFFIMPLDQFDNPVDLSDRNARVRGMLTLPTELFWHIVQGYELVAWRYTGSPLLTPIPSNVLSPTEIIQSRSPNPYLYWRGMSPLIVAMLAAQSDYAGEQFQKGLWVNNADTGVIVTTEQILDETQREAIKTALRERQRKAGTANRPLFLFGGAKVEKPSLSLMDLQFLETRKFLRGEIFSIFGVPEPLAGFTENLNDGGAGGSLDAVKGSFIESTIGSLCAQLEAACDPIVQTFGDDLVGWFDIDSLPIMQSQRRARWDTAGKMFAMGIAVDDINENLDLGLPDRPWYKNGYLPFNLQVAGQPPEPLPGEELPAPKKEDDTEDDADKSGNPFERMGRLLSAIGNQKSAIGNSKGVDVVALWKKHITARRSQVNLFKGKVSKVLNVYRAKTLAKLAEVHLEKSAGRLGEIKSLVDIIFSHIAFGESLNSELKSPITALLQSAGEETMAEIGHDDPWEYPPKGVLEYLTGRKQKIMGCGETVRNQLNTSLEEGVTAGETHLQLAGRVKDVFNTMTDSEAKRVAMTEVNIGYNTSRQQAMSDAGIEFKAWLSSHGPHVRAAHAEAEDAYINDPIPIDEPFEVMGEQLMFPGDDSLGASAENIINCQCIQLAAQKTDEDEKSLTFNVLGFGSMKFLKHENTH